MGESPKNIVLLNVLNPVFSCSICLICISCFRLICHCTGVELINMSIRSRAVNMFVLVEV